MTALPPMSDMPLLVYQSPLYVAPEPFCSSRIIAVGFVVGAGVGVVVGAGVGVGVGVGVGAAVGVGVGAGVGVGVGVGAGIGVGAGVVDPPVEPPVPGLPTLKSTRYTSEYSVGYPDCF